jgi:hypothetical protein
MPAAAGGAKRFSVIAVFHHSTAPRRIILVSNHFQFPNSALSRSSRQKNTQISRPNLSVSFFNGWKNQCNPRLRQTPLNSEIHACVVSGAAQQTSNSTSPWQKGGHHANCTTHRFSADRNSRVNDSNSNTSTSRRRHLCPDWSAGIACLRAADLSGRWLHLDARILGLQR